MADRNEEVEGLGRGAGGGSSVPAGSTVEDAMQGARRALAQLWNETGCWRDGCDAGPTATAVVAVALKFIGRLDADTARGVASYLGRIDLGNGAFPSHPGGDTPDLAATATCYAGLVAAGADENDPRRTSAKKFMDANGGEAKLIELARAGDLSALALAMVGELKAELPTAPLLFSLSPGAEYLLAHRFGYLIPFRALVSDVIAAHLRGRANPSPPRPLRLPWLTRIPRRANELADRVDARLSGATADVGTRAAKLGGSVVRGAVRRLVDIAQGGVNAAARAADSVRIGPVKPLGGALRGALDTGRAVAGGVMSAVSIVDRLLPGALGAGRTIVQHLESLRCDLYLHRFRNEDGSWLYGDAIHTALALAAYHALGVPSNDPTIAESVDWLTGETIKVPLDHGAIRFNVFCTDIWPTAFALRALLESGTQVTDPAISRAVNWLIAVQRSGSWAFQATNTTTPDLDDTAVAMATLAIARDHLKAQAVQVDPNLTAFERRSLRARCDGAIEAAKGFLLARQNLDGGWASYQPGLPGKTRGAMLKEQPEAPPLGSLGSQLRFTLNPGTELGDPATEDVTGRVLFALGKSGVTANHPAVAKAIQFLKNQQDTNHGWWGRWVVNYVASTAWVLRGLVAVGADLREPFVQNALAFLLSRQGVDGGWIDSVKSYRDPSFQLPARTASNPCLTGLVLCALIDLGGADPRSVQAGVDFLLRYHHDAGWDVTDVDSLHTLYPPALFYTLRQTVLQLPLEALALFQRRKAASQGAPVALEVGAALADPFRTLRLPLPPEQIIQLKRTGDVEADAAVDEIFNQNNHITSPAARMGAIFQSLVKIADFTEDSMLAGPTDPAEREVLAALDLPMRELALDQGRIANAQKLFRDSGFGVPLVLFCSSLPQCYAVPYGARVLTASGRLVTNPRRRMVETAQLVFDVLSPGGLVAVGDSRTDDRAARRGTLGRGLRTARKVRLMHAAVRRLVSEDEGPRSDGSVPISQFEMLGTLMSFAVVVTDGLRALGRRVPEDQANDWLYLWRQVGKVLGIVEPRGLSLETAADGGDFFEHVREDWGPSNEGSVLARSTLDLMRELLPGTEFDGIGPTLVRHLAGERCADLLGVEPSDWTRILIDPSPVVATIEGRVVGRLFETPLTPLLQRAAFGTMKALSRLLRPGKDAQFSIPPDLLSGWESQFQGQLRASNPAM